MAKTVVDASVEQALLVPSGTFTAETFFPGLRTSPLLWPTCVWAVAVTAASATGSYSLTLEVSPSVNGTYNPISLCTWPLGSTTPRHIQMGVNGSMAAHVVGTALYARVHLAVSGATPSISLSSWLSTVGGSIGLAHKPGDLVVRP
jgi:hypothetical protein